jgi:hypothetical protein
MEPEGSLPRRKQPTTRTRPEPDQSRPRTSAIQFLEAPF